MGLSDVGIHSFPVDGKHSYRSWIPDLAWDVTRAEIWIKSPVEAKLADWETCPIAVHQGSWGTPASGVACDLVDVGAGTTEADCAGIDVRENVVLTSGPPRQVYKEAVIARGAAGILSSHMTWQLSKIGRTPEALPDLVS